METRHTPGPWLFCGTHVDDSMGLPLIRTAHKDFEKLNCADMHLIAAAPQLLDALVRAVEATGHSLSGPTHPDVAEIKGEPRWVADARTAIQKATDQ